MALICIVTYGIAWIAIKYTQGYMTTMTMSNYISIYQKKILFLYHNVSYPFSYKLEKSRNICRRKKIQFRNSKPSSNNLPFLIKGLGMRWRIQHKLCNIIEKDWSTVQDSKINKFCCITMLFLQNCINDR